MIVSGKRKTNPTGAFDQKTGEPELTDAFQDAKTNQ
jgi:hypothetical protein